MSKKPLKKPNAIIRNQMRLQSRPGSILIIMLSFFIFASLVLTSCSQTADSSTAETTGTSAPVDSTDPDTSSETSEPADESSEPSEPVETTPEPTSEPTPEPTQPQPTSAIPSDPHVEDFFGPLPVPEQIAAFERNELRAIYIGAAANIEQALEIARKTEVNAVVLDLKESDGIKYASEIPLALENGLVRPAFNLQEVVARFHAEDVKVIGRIVCFKDPLLAEKRPDLAINDQSGNQLFFSNEGGKPFVNPYNQDVWQFNIDIAVEAIDAGIDEIQFDYVRFPTGGTTSGAKPYFGPEDSVPKRFQVINRFLQTANVHIQDERGVSLGADVFGIIIESELDGNNLGQDWKTVGLTGIDNVSPMIYPSHYANSSTTHYSGNGRGTMINKVHFEKPDLYPYEVMYNALLAGQAVTGQPGYAVNRPYLQAFTASYLPSGYYIEYGAAEIKAQIQAIRDAGYKEWICWNPRAEYPMAAFDPES